MLIYYLEKRHMKTAPQWLPVCTSFRRSISAVLAYAESLSYMHDGATLTKEDEDTILVCKRDPDRHLRVRQVVLTAAVAAERVLLEGVV